MPSAQHVLPACFAPPHCSYRPAHAAWSLPLAVVELPAFAGSELAANAVAPPDSAPAAGVHLSSVLLPISRHCEYHSFRTMQVPTAQHCAPPHLRPPHWPCSPAHAAACCSGALSLPLLICVALTLAAALPVVSLPLLICASLTLAAALLVASLPLLISASLTLAAALPVASLPVSLVAETFLASAWVRKDCHALLLPSPPSGMPLTSEPA